MAAKAGKFVAEQERGFVQREGASVLRMVFGFQGGGTNLLRKEERTDGTGLFGRQAEVRHARAIAGLMTERTERGGMGEITFQPGFLDAQAFGGERRRGVGARRDAVMTMTRDAVQRAEQRLALRCRDVGELLSGGGETLPEGVASRGVEREEMAGEALDLSRRIAGDFAEVSEIGRRLKELRGHRRGRHAELRRCDEVLRNPITLEANADIRELDGAMAALAFVIMAGQADEPVRKIGVKRVLRDGRGVARSVQAGWRRRPVAIRVALSFEEGREGEGFLGGQRKGGHARDTEVLSDADGVLKKVEEPRRLVAQARAAEIGCVVAQRIVLRQITVALGAADLRDELSAVRDGVWFSFRCPRMGCHPQHAGECEQRGWQPTMAGQGHEPF